MTGVGGWLRYGGPIRPGEIDFAVDHYRVAVLQPWELEAAGELKRRRPDMTVLCYKCLSSVRDYEPGPIRSSGISSAEAETGDWFARRADGERIQWKGYSGHWQLAVWDQDYQQRWIDNVVGELDGSPFDGVMADNDVFDDYYGLCPPLQDIGSIADIRTALDGFVPAVGRALNAIGKLLVPNIAESRRSPGRWRAHAAHGGGFEEVWLGWDPDALFDPGTALAQMEELVGPGISLVRVPTNGDDDHPNFRYGLAAFWVFGGGRGAFTATGHDDYNRTPYIPELDWDLGQPQPEPLSDGHLWWRAFAAGWAAVNLDLAENRIVNVPDGLVDEHGTLTPQQVTLPPTSGLILRRA